MSAGLRADVCSSLELARGQAEQQQLCRLAHLTLGAKHQRSGVFEPRGRVGRVATRGEQQLHHLLTEPCRVKSAS